MTPELNEQLQTIIAPLIQSLVVGIITLIGVLIRKASQLLDAQADTQAIAQLSALAEAAVESTEQSLKLDRQRRSGSLTPLSVQMAKERATDTLRKSLPKNAARRLPRGRSRDATLDAMIEQAVGRRKRRAPYILETAFAADDDTSDDDVQAH